jgi:alanyl-tRNA synthetase
MASVRRRDQILHDLGREFTCGDEGLRAAVAKLRQELRQRTDSLGSLQKALAVRLAQETLAANPPAPEGTSFLPLHVPEGDMAFARMLAEELCRRSDVVALCSYQDPVTQDTGVVLQRSTQGHFDCGRWFKDVCVPKGGRGGGTSLRAEGRLPKSVPWTELTATLR